MADDPTLQPLSSQGIDPLGEKVAGEAMKAVLVRQYGGIVYGWKLHDLYIHEYPKPVAREREVIIRVEATGVNRAEILQRRGKYAPPAGETEILGLEAVGEIVSIGPNCELELQVGQRVLALLSGGGYAEYASVDERSVLPFPENLSVEEAAAIPEAWITAFQLLHFIAKVNEGDYILIHGGGSGVGTALIQLVVSANAHAIVTAGSQEKLDKARELGAIAAINYREEDFVEQVLQATHNHGADVILDCVGGSFFEKNIRSAAQDARWILYGLLGGDEIQGHVLSQLLRKRIRLEATTLRNRSLEYKGELIKAFTEQILPKFASRQLCPIIHSIFDIGDVQAAHDLVERNENIGKVILRASFSRE